MRIFSGSAKNREISVPKGVALRPSEGQVRQAAYNIWGPGIDGLTMLDLYCGSGSIGLEGLSRGLGKVVFVDLEARCLKSVAEHAERFGFIERYETLRSDALASIRVLESKTLTFDLVFVDPPYDLPDATGSLQALGASTLLHPASRVLFEHSRRHEAPPQAGQLTLWRQHDYGESRLSHYRLVPKEKHAA